MLAAPCWHEFMEEQQNSIHQQALSNHSVYQRSNNQISTPMLNGNYINTKEYKNIETGEIKTINEIHNILYYVNKNNLLESPSDNPLNDPQFWNWEISNTSVGTKEHY